MPIPEGEIALLCDIFPSTESAQVKILSLLRKGARDYYREPSSRCKCWSYCLPTKSSIAAGNVRQLEPVICGLEVYSDKTALSAQLNNAEFFQSYHRTVEHERLYARPEQLVAWYRTTGFLRRESTAESGAAAGKGIKVSVTKIAGRDEQNAKQILEALRDWVMHVEANETDVLTYIVFTRPKAPKEVLIFIRYRSGNAMQRYATSPEHQKVSKTLASDMKPAVFETTTWNEIDDSFVTFGTPTVDDQQPSAPRSSSSSSNSHTPSSSKL